MKKGLIFALSASAAISMATLSGCATMTDAMSTAAGMGVVSTSRDNFNGGTNVSVSPMPLWAPGSWGNQVQLGAIWTSSAPDSVALEMSFRSNVNAAGSAYASLSGMDIKVDGELTKWRTGAPTSLNSSAYNTVSKTIYTSSSNAVVIPYALLQRMVAAKDCRLRIYIGSSYEDAQFNLERIPGGQPTALLSIRKFMVKVDSMRAALPQGG